MIAPEALKPTVATWVGFALMSIGLFMAVLDVQIVATSLPNIQRSLHIDPDQMSWVQTVYLTAEVVAIPLSGLLTRALSLRRLATIGIGCFTLASLGCAASSTFALLIIARIVQGFFGGLILPLVFSAVFLLFPPRLEAFATTLAGVLAVLATTLGPIIGGWITETYNWHGLFLINILPGIIACIGVATLLPTSPSEPALLRHCDAVGLILLAASLAALLVGLKQAPDYGWLSTRVIGLLAAAALGLGWFVRHSGRRAYPLVELRALLDRRIALASYLNFTLGIGLFGSVYLMPVFLGLVRDHNALEIGRIMLVTGIAQLITAPIAVILEKRMHPMLLSMFGFGLFGVGLWMSTNQSAQTDAAQMMWAQIVRGSAAMLCILPPTRLALGHLALEDVPNASGLFNLMRNLGGAVGLALIDTVIYGRTPHIADGIIARLKAGDVPTAKQLGLPIDDFLAARGQPVDEDTRAILAPLIHHQALAEAINMAWLLIGGLTLLGVLVILVTALRRRAVAAG